MPPPPDAHLSANQKSMLDLALGCDLKVSDPSQHAAIRSRHQAIRSQRDAAQYIGEIETKIHSRRKFHPVRAIRLVQAVKAAAPPITTGAATSGAILFLIVLMVAAGFAGPGWNLGLITVLMFSMMWVLGVAITRQPFGVLINNRNVMSLARFQMAVWTVVILAAYFTFVFMRIRAGVPEPLNVALDPHLWALLGISTTSMVGSPLILSTKIDKVPDSSVAPKTAALLDENPTDINANKQGTLYANTAMKDASLTDMFQGDELGNTAHLDLAKVQMFYFTLIAVICFFVMVFKTVVSGVKVTDPIFDHLPVLSDGFVAVLGISHAGYLSSKGINHTKTQP
jgi:hypothetical protein